MQIYQCHKRVKAFKIEAVNHDESGTIALLSDSLGNAVEVSENFLSKHNPAVGGYYVEYDDGYASFSPAAAFEAGYAPVTA